MARRLLEALGDGDIETQPCENEEATMANIAVRKEETKTPTVTTGEPSCTPDSSMKTRSGSIITAV